MAANEASNGGKRFGAFSGVFTPSILTILGVVMYLRLGWVTGQAGLAGVLLIVLVSHLISLATGLSVASIATNRTVGAGGAYFMISRALGAPVGAAIGIPLFFAQALSVTFYIVGFTVSVETLLHSLGEAWILEWIPPVLISTLVNLLLTALSLKSADLAIKAQYFVMGAIVLSLVSFFAGHTDTYPESIEWINPEGEGFGEVFAIFFPAVTGIMAGVSMSGDLKNPRRAIPIGTLAAISVGFVIYLAFPVWFALNASNQYLIDNADSAVYHIAWSPELIYAGVWGATLSSALGSVLTAPRTLQALAWDGLAPRFLGRGFGPASEPRLGTVLTFLLAQVGILLGSLDAIAGVLTMFFLATYGVTNLACGLERWAASPSFRPTFRVPALLSLLGAAGCFLVMSTISVGAMITALVLCGLIYILAERRALGTTYGDARHGLWAALVRTSLHRLRRVEFHPLNWRPNLIILGGDPVKRPHLIELGSAVVQDQGIVTYFHLLSGSVAEHADRRKLLRDAFERQIAGEFPNVFYRVDVVDTIYAGTVAVAQSYGIGNFESNTVMLGWPRKQERGEQYIQMLRDLVALDRSLLLVRRNEERDFKNGKTIHIWWGGLRGNGGLMLLLGFLITAHHRWRKAKVAVLTVVSTEEARAKTEKMLRDTIAEARLTAEPRVILRQRRTIPEIMRAESVAADLAIVGIRLPDPGEPVEPFFERMRAILEELPTAILVHSARNFQGEPVLFDERPSAPGNVPT